MSRTLTVSDDVYERLEATARRRGFQSIEQLLLEWQLDDDIPMRQQTVERIDALRERLFTHYGEMSDNTPLLREDRNR